VVCIGVVGIDGDAVPPARPRLQLHTVGPQDPYCSPHILGSELAGGEGVAGWKGRYRVASGLCIQSKTLYTE
jgi:hypothetical protein